MIAAFTIVRDDPLLEKWLLYYGAYCDFLGVIDQGNASELCAQYGVERYEFRRHPTSWRDNIEKAVAVRKELLARDYRVVIFADADEYLIPDLNYYENLRAYLEDFQRDYTYTMGREILHTGREDPISWDRPVLEQRAWWGASDKFYGKPAVATVSFPISEGAHSHQGKSRNKNNTDINLYMVHLKLADRDMAVLRGGLSESGATLESVNNAIEIHNGRGRIPDWMKGSGI